MTVFPLGTGGFIPNASRETASVLLIDDDCAVLFDAGSGVRRLLEPAVQAALRNVTTLNVVLSHFHLDHTCGLTWLLRLWQRPMEIYVPTAPMVESDGLQAIEALTSEPFFGLPIRDWPQVRALHVLADGATIGSRQLRTLKQKHSGGSVGFRLGGFAYVTDFAPMPAHGDFVRGADLVLMDTMYDSAKAGSATSEAQHGNSVSNATIARDADVAKLGLIHIDPLFSADQVEGLLSEAREIFEGTFLPEEGTQYVVHG